jgi:hypothetical protein
MLRQCYSSSVHLLIFVDCLVILDVIRKWGCSDFHPSPREIVHFAVIYPLLQELRKWIGKVTLLKVKNHTGCLLNERADELAESVTKICSFIFLSCFSFSISRVFRYGYGDSDRESCKRLPWQFLS